MKYTSAEANKLIRKLEEKISMLLNAERKSYVFNAAAGEDVEALRPEYSFSETQAKLEVLQQKIRTVKHAVNEFNLSTELPGFPGLTIDQALVLIPQLGHRKSMLKEMAGKLPREREVSFGRSNIIDYVITNYNIDEVTTKYNEVNDYVMALQIALDTVNTTETMEIDVTLD